jgi:ATP-binding cassette subfamily B protein
MRRLKAFYLPEAKFLYLSVFFLMCATAFGLVYPMLLSYLIENVIKQNQFEKVPMLALIVVGAISLKAVNQFLHGFFGGRLGNKVAYRMRNALYDKLQTLSYQYYDKAKTGDLMSRLTADLEAIRQFIGFGFAQILNMAIMILFGGGMMLYYAGAYPAAHYYRASIRKTDPSCFPGNASSDEQFDNRRSGKYNGSQNGQILCPRRT